MSTAAVGAPARGAKARSRALAATGWMTAGLLTLAACAGGSTPTGSGGSATTPATTRPSPGRSAPAGPASSPSAATDAAAAIPPPPPGRGCYRLPFDALADSSTDAPPVSCTGEHTTQTIYVGNLDTVLQGHSLAVDSKTAQAQMARTCSEQRASYLGGDANSRRLSRFVVLWFRPTLAQGDAGANWFRCDIAALAGSDRLFPLPSSLAGILNRSSALDTYGLCGTAAPGSPGFDRVICGSKHSWKAISSIDIAGGDAYPGTSAVRQAGDSTCANQVHQRVGFTLKYQYGWEWPSAQQWQQGQHYGFCWAPA